MAKTLQFRRGTTTELSTVAGAVGELFVDTTKDTVVVMDGSTAGGFPLAKESDISAKANTSDVTTALAGKASTSDLTTGLAGKQDTLVSGTNIKTVNGTSILGSGNITISGGSGGGDLTQVASDITPTFDSVYDLGSSTNRFYDAYLGNTVDVNGATITGSSILIPGGTSTTYTTSTQQLSTGAIPSGATASNGYIMPWNAASLDEAKLLALPVGTVVTIQGTTSSYMMGGGTGTIIANNGLVGPGPNGWMAVQLVWDQVVELISISSITWEQSTSTPVVTQLPDTYDYTLASNATLVAPSVAADTSLVGGLFTEGTTVTPEHILGAYTDTKGTLTIDGSLKVNEELAVRNAITLQQESVPLGTVVSKQNTSTLAEVPFLASTDNWSSVLGTSTFYAYTGRLAFSYPGDLRNYYPAGWAGFTPGSILIVTVNGGYYYKHTITDVTFDGSYTNINYSAVETNHPDFTTLTALTYNGMFSLGQAGNAMATASLSKMSEVTSYEVTLDTLAVPLVNGVKLAINDAFTTTPVTQSFSQTGTISDFGWSDSSGTGANRTLKTGGQSLNTTTTPGLLTTLDIFSLGSRVTIVYNGNSGVFDVTSSTIGYDMMSGPDTALYFTLQYVSGYDFISQGGIEYALGMMSQQVNWSSSLTTLTNYTSAYVPQLIASTTSVNKYVSTSAPFDWLNVGDSLSYIPLTTSIKFKKDDGTSVKAITYNNGTGTLTYEGIPDSPISLLSNTNMVSSNARYANDPTNYNSVAHPNNGGYSVAIGDNAFVQGSSVAIGQNASSSLGVAIGRNALATYQGVAIGYDASGYASGENGTAVGYNTSNLSYKNIALGYSVNSGIYTSTPYYTVPGLILTPKTREAVISLQSISWSNVFWLYVGYPGSSISTTSSSSQINIQDFLNFNASHAIITVEFLISTNGVSDYWASGVKRYKYNNYMGSAGKLTELTAPVATQRGTDTYANNLDFRLLNNGAQQELSIVTNASDTNSKNVIINISANLL